MTADDRGEPGRQRTVAELLKQYGGEDQSAPRRRRRAADSDDAPEQPAGAPPSQRSDEPPPRERGVDRVTGSFNSFDFDPPTGPEPGHPRSVGPDAGDWTSSGSFPAEPYRSPDSFGGDPLGDPYPPAAPDSYLPDDPYRRPDPPSGDGFGGNLTSPPRRPEDSTDFIPRFGDRRGRSGPPPRPVDETGPGTAITSHREMFDDEPQPDRDDYRAFEQEFPGDGDGRQLRRGDPNLGGPRTDPGPGSEMYADEDDLDPDEMLHDPVEVDDEPSGFLGRRLGRVAGEPEPDEFPQRAEDPLEHDDDVPAGLDGHDDPDAEQRGPQSNVVTWLLLIGQLVVGAIVGAALWIGFRYLWLNFPVVALAAAVIATAGLVLLVRAIRRSDDLQTTMLAVLVGLVVTISPAVLLLASR